MCGIAGIFHFRSDARVDEAVLARMRDTMVHRGPNGGASWVSPDGRVGLAHRRLSIIDLSGAANQPMPNEDGTVWVTFNGEIYNHLNLRSTLEKAGHTFRTDHSDTEVLVHGYEEWGFEGLLERLDGDYGIGLWDGRIGNLYLARDRVGVKPVYFAERTGALLFASEIKAIVAHPAVTPDVDPMAMYHYLSFLTTPAPMTMFKGISKLPAGTWLCAKRDGTLRAGRYWAALPGRGIPPEELAGLDTDGRERFYVKGIRQRLVDAVDKRMMSDVPFGVFLSGGIDSSTNVALMSRFVTQPLETFTVGFSDHRHLNELDYAEAVARRFNTRHHQVLIAEKDMIGYLDELVYHQDEPIADWVCIPLYFVSRLTRDSGVTVVQVGEGSDEQFAGYAGYMKTLRLYERYWQPYRRWVPSFLRHAVANVARAAARRLSRVAMLADLLDRAGRDRELFWTGATVFWESMKVGLVDRDAIIRNAVAPQECGGLFPPSFSQTDSYGVIAAFRETLDRHCPDADFLTRMIHQEFQLRLPELLLMRVDKISMSLSLEARVPFLDHRLVEFTMDIPMGDKVRGGEAKHLLKKAVDGWIPNDIIQRPKMGFGAPMTQWLRGGFGREAQARLLGSALMRRDWFDRSRIESLFEEHRAGRRDNGMYLWALFNLGAWHDYWVAGKGRLAEVRTTSQRYATP